MAALLTRAIIKPSVLCTLVGRIPGILKRIKPGGTRVAVMMRFSSTHQVGNQELEGPFLYLSSRRNRLTPSRLTGPAADATAP